MKRRISKKKSLLCKSQELARGYNTIFFILFLRLTSSKKYIIRIFIIVVAGIPFKNQFEFKKKNTKKKEKN